MTKTKAQIESKDLEGMVSRVCGKIPPLWDLKNYVAVNPFLGFSDKPWLEAAQTISDGLDAQVLPPLEFYRGKMAEGQLNVAGVRRAAQKAGRDPVTALDILAGKQPMPQRISRQLLSFAKRYDRDHQTRLNNAILKSISRWCSFYAAKGTATWPLDQDAHGLYSSWKEGAPFDRSLEIAGLPGWRRWSGTLPDTSTSAIESFLNRLPIPSEDRENYLYGLLGDLYGWSSYWRWFTWGVDGLDHDPLKDLLAMRLAGEVAVVELAPEKEFEGPDHHARSKEEEGWRVIFQEALEDSYLQRLLPLFKSTNPTRPSVPEVQAVFCIDVRSEVFRRHLESLSRETETLGFAGFFGLALDWNDGGSSARCPVLLSPSISVDPVEKISKTPSKLFKYLQTAPSAAFSWVEITGLAYGFAMGKDSVGAVDFPKSPEESSQVNYQTAANKSEDLANKVQAAAGILKNTGLLKRLGKLILLCGHESRSTNNPHAAGLDCGACGGHSGALNARVAAILLNDPKVREGLKRSGIVIPDSTFFLAGVHDTSNDEVRLLDENLYPPSHRSEIEKLKVKLSLAGEWTRKERAGSLGLDQADPRLLAQLEKRSKDWSEVRPEWALARNAAFIAARRQRTRAADFEGRSFLHEYDWNQDQDGSVLSLILSAPMVVASWINLQYFASTVDNQVFGCGDKALQNPIKDIGVVLGNGGDLRTGLALQSVHYPNGAWYHEPLRLQVIVEAPTGHIDFVLDQQRGVLDLVQNGWVRLFALDPQKENLARYLGPGKWEAMNETVGTKGIRNERQ